MESSNYNCMICAQECDINQLHYVKMSSIILNKFKICASCLNLSDPKNDYQEVKDIVDAYSKIY